MRQAIKEVQVTLVIIVNVKNVVIHERAVVKTVDELLAWERDHTIMYPVTAFVDSTIRPGTATKRVLWLST